MEAINNTKYVTKISNLRTLCIKEMFKLNDQHEPTFPQFDEIFGANHKDSTEWRVFIALYKLKVVDTFDKQNGTYAPNKEAIDVATLPFYEKASQEYLDLLIAGLSYVLEKGDEHDTEEAFFAYLNLINSM